jgi:tetratricopeptide (TPR) repeat protein
MNSTYEQRAPSLGRERRRLCARPALAAALALCACASGSERAGSAPVPAVPAAPAVPAGERPAVETSRPREAQRADAAATPRLDPRLDIEARTSSPSGAAEQPAADQRPAPEDLPELESRAIAAIRAREYETARALLGDLLFADYLARARELIASGQPEDGLPWVEKLLVIDARHAEGLLLLAEGQLSLAEHLANGAGASFAAQAFEDALRSFERAEASPRRELGRARALWWLGRPLEALEHARAGVALLGGGPELEIRPLPERTLADSALSAVTAAQTEGRMPEELAPLAREAEAALEHLLGRTPSDPWAWSHLSGILAFQGRWPEAQAVAERGLARAPLDRELWNRAREAAYAVGGAANARASADAWALAHPDLALAALEQARARFEEALASGQGRGEPRDFAAAEALAERAAGLDPLLADEALGWRVVARAAAGWSHLERGELGAAEECFRSMELLRPRGLEWQIEGRLGSGVLGLHALGAAELAAGELERAAEVYAYLHAYQPDVADWANNAGFLFRDAAVEREHAAELLCRAARDPAALDPEALASARSIAGLAAAPAVSDAERAILAAAASERAAQARLMMRKSWEAYRASVDLAPHDVRGVNDAALVLIYYLHSDLDRAAELLLRAAADGAAQMEDPALDERARYELANAWGDACQNLGALYLFHRRDPAHAKAYLEQSVAIGPDPRPLLTEVWLPLCEGRGDAAEIDAFLRWAVPCAP